MKTLGLSESDLSKFEITASLESALDKNFRRLFETAKSVWEHRFAGNDPSDACVSVRIAAVDAAPEVAATRGSDFVKSPSGSVRRNKTKLALHFVH